MLNIDSDQLDRSRSRSGLSRSVRSGATSRFSQGPSTEGDVGFNQAAFRDGSIKPGVSNITYTVEGKFLLAKDEQSQYGVMYDPIYIFDTNTIFTMGVKLVRAKKTLHIEEEKK